MFDRAQNKVIFYFAILFSINSLFGNQCLKKGGKIKKSSEYRVGQVGPIHVCTFPSPYTGPGSPDKTRFYNKNEFSFR